jgi:hypothetical protein
MSLKLTAEMSAAVREQNGHLVTVEDADTHQEFVLLPLEFYQRIKAVFADESFDVVDAYAAQSAVAGAAGWDDPEMDVYDNYDAHRPQS